MNILPPLLSLSLLFCSKLRKLYVLSAPLLNSGSSPSRSPAIPLVASGLFGLSSLGFVCHQLSSALRVLLHTQVTINSFCCMHILSHFSQRLRSASQICAACPLTRLAQEFPIPALSSPPLAMVQFVILNSSMSSVLTFSPRPSLRLRGYRPLQLPRSRSSRISS